MSERIFTIFAINKAMWDILCRYPEAGYPSYRGAKLDMACSTPGGGTGVVIGFDGGKVGIRPDVARGVATVVLVPEDVVLATVKAGMAPAEIKWSQEAGAARWQGVLAMLRGMFLNVEAPL